MKNDFCVIAEFVLGLCFLKHTLILEKNPTIFASVLLVCHSQKMQGLNHDLWLSL